MNFSHDLLRVWSKRANTCSSISYLIIFLVYAFLLAACQTGRPTVSLDEAKQISLQFSDASFVPPPRSINDLLEEIGFYTGKERGTCNPEPMISLEKIDKLLEYAPPYPQKGCKARVLVGWAARELNRGNYSRSIKLLKMARESLPAGARGVSGAHGNRLTAMAAHYAHAGDFDSATKALSESYDWYGEIPRQYWDCSITYFISSAKAAIEQMQGDYLSAEKHIRDAIDASIKMDKKYKLNLSKARYLLKADLAENLMLQGRILEAEIYNRDLMNFSKHFPGSSDEWARGRVLLVMSKILFVQGRVRDAEILGKAAVNAYLISNTDCSSVFLNLSRKTVARAMMAQGRWKEALAQFDFIRDGMKNDPDAFDARFGGDVDWATALVVTGRIREAMDRLKVCLERTIKRFGEKHYHAAEIRGLIAMANAAAGRQETAMEGFNEAVSLLLAQSSRTQMETRSRATQDQRLTLILDGYIRLLADIHGTSLETMSEINAAGVAFSLADVVRSRAVKSAVDASSARSAVKDSELADLTRREQDAGQQLIALYGVLANAVSQSFAEQDPKVIQSLREKIDKLSNARFSIVTEIESRFPKYERLINPSPLSLENARAALVPGESLVSIYIGHDRSYIWAVPYQGKIAFTSVPLGRQEIGEMVDKLRYALVPNAKTLGEIPEFDLETAYAIYQAFLKPVRKGWENAKSLLIVPHGALGYLPLSLLPTKPAKLSAKQKILLSNYQDVPWLVRSHAVTVLPSVSSLTTLRALPPGDPNRRAFVGFGDPYFSEQQAKAASKPKEKVETAAITNRDDYSLRGITIERIKTDQLDSAELARLPRLPETADEIRSIASALNADLTQDVFTGNQANEHQVKTMDLSVYKVVAFATHGLAPGDLNGLLQPALALSSPKVSGMQGDGLLTMGEILGLRLNADWVILSACNTGAGKEEGAEALSGLGKAFFYAGARALLVSSWPVETSSAKALTTELFKRQAKNASLTRAEALRESMLFLIDRAGYIDPASDKLVFSYAHPIFWAPFTLVGDGIGTAIFH